MSTLLKRLWRVHLATPNVEGGFSIEVRDDTEHGALAQALRYYPMCYVVYTEEVKE